MGNSQGPMKRDRADSASGGRSPRPYTMEEECPLQLKFARTTPPTMGSALDGQIDEYPVVIKWPGNAKQVYISGSWNKWAAKIPLVKSSEDFVTIVNLPEGRHEYKYMVDGQWMCDNKASKTQNTVGTENNVLTIDKSEFEVFDALDRDMQHQPSQLSSASSTLDSASTGTTASVNSSVVEGSGSNGGFGQEIPDRKAFAQAAHPPVLPPHLLQVILNKDTPVQCDPNVLPEPNHVMLNHLYALSIKDGVMVLSATHRYRKKYVTTLLYKPI